MYQSEKAKSKPSLMMYPSFDEEGAEPSRLFHEHARLPAESAVLRTWQAQDGSEQRPHKISYHVSAKNVEAELLVKSVEAKIQSEGLAAKVIYSGGEDLDILPQGASKGKGLEFLLQEVPPACSASSSHMLKALRRSCFSNRLENGSSCNWYL